MHIPEDGVILSPMVEVFRGVKTTKHTPQIHLTIWERPKPFRTVLGRSGSNEELDFRCAFLPWVGYKAVLRSCGGGSAQGYPFLRKLRMLEAIVSVAMPNRNAR
eukprot:2643552-Amphidinium_carterae.1